MVIQLQNFTKYVRVAELVLRQLSGPRIDDQLPRVQMMKHISFPNHVVLKRVDAKSQGEPYTCT